MKALDIAPPFPSDSPGLSPCGTLSPHPPDKNVSPKALHHAPPPSPSHTPEPSPLGYLSKIPLELRLQIYRLLLGGLSRLRKSWELLFIWHHPKLDASCEDVLPLDLAILGTSKAVNAEAGEVFYSTNEFDFWVPPSSSQSVKPSSFSTFAPFGCIHIDKESKKWRLMSSVVEVFDLNRNRGFRKSKASLSRKALNLINEVKDPKAWIMTLPSQQAFDLIKDIQISFPVPGYSGPERHDYSEGSLGEEIVKKLRSPKVLRNSLCVDLFPGTILNESDLPVLKFPFFQGLTALTDFKYIDIRIPHGKFNDAKDIVGHIPLCTCTDSEHCPDCCVVADAIKKELEPTLGPATLHLNLHCGVHIISFQPRSSKRYQTAQRESLLRWMKTTSGAE